MANKPIVAKFKKGTTLMDLPSVEMINITAKVRKASADDVEISEFTQHKNGSELCGFEIQA